MNIGDKVKIEGVVISITQDYKGTSSRVKFSNGYILDFMDIEVDSGVSDYNTLELLKVP